LTLKRLDNQEPIDRGKFNELVDAINKLEDANNLQARVKTSSGDFSTFHNKVIVQGMRLSFNGSADGKLGTVTFPEKFSAVPVVTVTFYSTGGSYVIPQIWELTASGFVLHAKATEPGYTIPSAMHANIIAIGPTARTF
jgi:hypothetical protein